MVLDFGFLKSGLFPESEQTGDGLGGDKQAGLLSSTILGQVEEINIVNTIAIYEKHWYRFDNAATDNGVETDDLTATGATMVTTQFKQGTHSSLYDADTEYFATTADAYWTPAEFTHNFWFYPTAAPADWRALVGMNIGAGVGFTMRYLTDLTVTLWDDNESTNFLSTTGALTLNAWNMITVTRTSGNDFVVYINTVSAGTGSSATVPAATGQTVRIGARGANDRNARGYIDDYRIYDTVLSAADIATLYGGGAGLQTPLNSNLDVFTLTVGTTTSYMWIDETGDLRAHTSLPTRLHDGTIVGTQS